MIIDVHCHYTFSRLPRQPIERFSFEDQRSVGGSPDPGTGFCADPREYDSFVSPRALNRLSWRLARALLHLPPAGPELDRALQTIWSRHLLKAGPVDRIVLLAFDAYHDRAGRLAPIPADDAEFGSDIYTSNSLIRSVCRTHPERFLFGASIHPYRPGALAALDEVFHGGASLLKWLPLHQNIDAADPRSVTVLRRCAELGLPVLVHYNEEFTLATQHPELMQVAPLLATLRRLRRAGCAPTVIVAHVATPVFTWGDTAMHDFLVDGLLGEFADAPLYADISALTAWGKVPLLRRLARMQDLHPKLLFGSDFPVPPATPRLRSDLGRQYGAIAAESSWVQQAALIYRRMGFNEIVFQRAATLLANRDAFSCR